MSYQFLCPHHRERLSAEPSEAARIWARGMEAAQRLARQGRWMEALRHAGCAVEVARVMLNQPDYCDRRWHRNWAAARGLFQMVNVKLGEPAPRAAEQDRKVLH